MTYEEVLASDKDMLTPYDIAPILRANPATLRMTARDYPERVKFPFIFLLLHDRMHCKPFIRQE